jgi:hypothetical protein
MKTLVSIVAIFSLGIASLTGCKKSKTPPGHYMTATAGSKVVSYPNAKSFFQGDTLTIQTGDIINPTYPYFELGIANYKTTIGTFDIGPAAVAYYHITPGVTATAVSGSIEITRTTADGWYGVWGKFHFVCDDGTIVTNGSFYSPPWYGLL